MFRNRRRIVVLSMVLLVAALLPASVARGQMPGNLSHCSELAFSTEEDFVTQGPEPADGNTIISDGDLLSASGVVCARNLDLLHDFNVNQDLGLDAADVLDVQDYIVAFSTELDSPNQDQFTAGDLLVTNGIIIPNVALTHLFPIGYDIGLDGVHFVGTDSDISAFLDEIGQYDRRYWLENPGNLATVLNRRKVDIWFSTEGTFAPDEPPLILDGDLLSAALGGVVVPQDGLLPSHVPAGIPNRGVDFGLDAVATTRTGDQRLIHFSTELLYDSERISFTDGDLLTYRNGVAAKNYDLTQAFEPKVRELGLDALSVAVGKPLPDCAPVIVQVGGMSTGSINPDGYANGMSVDLTFAAHDSPFGGKVKILGLLPDCNKCEQFKMEYGEWTGTDETVPPTTWNTLTPTFDEWIVGTTWLESLVHREADANGWYDILCNPKAGGLLMPWDTSGLDGRYSLRLTIKDAGGVDHVGTPEVVMIDNTGPAADLSLDTVPVCGDIMAGVSVTGQITGTDKHFYGYQLRYESSAGNGTLLERTYTSTSDTGDIGQPFTWPTAGLPKCGYRLILRVWDRTIVNNHRSYGDPGFGWREIDQAYFCVQAQ